MARSSVAHVLKTAPESAGASPEEPHPPPARARTAISEADATNLIMRPSAQSDRAPMSLACAGVVPGLTGAARVEASGRRGLGLSWPWPRRLLRKQEHP